MFSDMISKVTKETWIRFIDEVEPYRADMFRYALKLSGNPFERSFALTPRRKVPGIRVRGGY